MYYQRGQVIQRNLAARHIGFRGQRRHKAFAVPLAIQRFPDLPVNVVHYSSLTSVKVSILVMLMLFVGCPAAAAAAEAVVVVLLTVVIEQCLCIHSLLWREVCIVCFDRQE